MKLLFVYPGLHPSYPIQLGALSAYVKRGGHETQLFAPVLKDCNVPGHVLAWILSKAGVIRLDVLNKAIDRTKG